MNPLDFMNPFSGQLKQLEQTATDLQKSKFYEVFYPFFNVTRKSLLERFLLLIVPVINYPRRSAGLILDLYLPVLGYLLSVLISSAKDTITSNHFEFKYTSRIAFFRILIWVILTAIYYFILQSVHLPISAIQTASILGYSFVLSIFNIPIIRIYFIIVSGIHAVREGVRIVKSAQDTSMVENKTIVLWNWIVVSMFVAASFLTWISMW